MPERKKYAARYADALEALATATHRPTTVVNLDGRYAIRVELEFSRFALAANTPGGLSADPDASGTWTVGIHQDGATDPRPLAAASSAWLIDAFDAAFEELRQSANWIVTDIQHGELAADPDGENPPGR
ncbi:hypothetical protein [Rhodococcus sp. SGAir0479]|uniref:hypothetical protein n=1 Tax=Rhodococcus sp. SGAir0479 TaxID=2567884 RepID=UPI0010CD3558|nr:hypothetical protein [Rhodococcus sp. SGAir0479]QCQ91428.1 hypothetical protein E7742_09365 [Rhodococcus sp. SGAir0479]